MEGIGLRKDGEAINYQERAPLVIPPGRALPPPEKIRCRDRKKSGLADRSGCDARKKEEAAQSQRSDERERPNRAPLRTTSAR